MCEAGCTDGKYRHILLGGAEQVDPNVGDCRQSKAEE